MIDVIVFTEGKINMGLGFTLWGKRDAIKIKDAHSWKPDKLIAKISDVLDKTVAQNDLLNNYRSSKDEHGERRQLKSLKEDVAAQKSSLRDLLHYMHVPGNGVQFDIAVCNPEMGRAYIELEFTAVPEGFPELLHGASPQNPVILRMNEREKTTALSTILFKQNSKSFPASAPASPAQGAWTERSAIVSRGFGEITP